MLTGCDMAKHLILHKLIVDINTDEGDSNAVLLYQVNDSGNISKMHSVSVQGTINTLGIRSIIQDAKASAKVSEGIV